MKTTRFLNFDCVALENASLSLLVTQSVGPRIICLRFKGGENLLAELPDFVTTRPDGEIFHFYGGHRLWHAPENMPRTYVLDNKPVKIACLEDGLSITQPTEAETGIQKSVHIALKGDKPQVVIQHTLTNLGLSPVECAPWAITQLKRGGVAILPQSQVHNEFLPNRSVALWSYTDILNPCVIWGNRYHLIRSQMTEGAFKIGFPNPRGWLGYWQTGTLFVKRAAYESQASYYDFGSSSECYCNGRFIELETLAPIGILAPGASVTHTETWEVYAGVDNPENEVAVQAIVEGLHLG